MKKRDIIYVDNVLTYLLAKEALYPPKAAYALHRARRSVAKEAELIREAVKDYVKLQEERTSIVGKWRSGTNPDIEELNRMVREHESKNHDTTIRAEEFLSEDFSGELNADVTIEHISSGICLDKDGKERPILLSLIQMEILERTILRQE